MVGYEAGDGFTKVGLQLLKIKLYCCMDSLID